MRKFKVKVLGGDMVFVATVDQLVKIYPNKLNRSLLQMNDLNQVTLLDGGVQIIVRRME